MCDRDPSRARRLLYHGRRPGQTPAIVSAPMSRSLDESVLVKQLCSGILTAAQLKTLCQSRGFPITGAGKDVLAEAAVARFLEPMGVSAAMTALDPTWQRVLHVVAVADEPMSLNTLARLLGRVKQPDEHVDYRAFWNEVVEGMVSRGVVLVEDAPSVSWEKSRFARFHLVLPARFAHFLPPYALPSEPVGHKAQRGDLDDVLSDAIDVLAGDARVHALSTPMASRVAKRLLLKDGRLSFANLDSPDGARIARAVRDLWVASFVSGDRKNNAEILPGPMTVQILESLGPDKGVCIEALTAALTGLGLKVKSPEVGTFLEDGVTAGFLVRLGRRNSVPLYGISKTPAVSTRDALSLTTSTVGTLSVAGEAGTGLVPLLQAATVARITLKDGALVLEPDLVRTGRAWLDLPELLRTTLTVASPAFRDAAALVEKRAGQVVVHRGLTVLRVEDAGLHALLVQRMGEFVRPLGGRHVAFTEGRLAEVLAFTRKEGYVARRQP